MKVYILFQTDPYMSWSNRVLYGVYSSREKAVEIAEEARLEDYPSAMDIIECELDAVMGG